MTPTQVRDLVADLLTWRQAQAPSAGGPAAPGDHIGVVRPDGGDAITVDFYDGTTAVITVTTEGGPE